MDLKGTVVYIIVVFGGSVFMAYAWQMLSGNDTIAVSTITGLIVFSILTSFLRFIFISKKHLNRKQIYMRTGIHLMAIIALALSAATLMNWVSWHEPVRVILFIVQVVIVYIAITAINTRQTKKLADELNEKLKERYNR